jgi:hypothetical protein
VAEEQVAAEPTNDAELPGLEADAVVAVVSDHQGAVNGCHAVGTDVGTTGTVTLTWSIAPSGQVEDVAIAQSTFENATFHECIVAVISGLEFPAAPGSTEVGGWRFRFRSSEN